MEHRSERRPSPTRASLAAWFDRQTEALRRLQGTPPARAFWAVCAFTLLTAVVHVFDALLIDSSVFSFDDTWSFPSFASSLLFLLGGWASWRAARADSTAEGTATWTVIAVIMGLFAIEVLIDIHHRVEGIANLEVLVLISYPVLGLVALFLLLPRVLRFDPPAPLLLLVGGLLLIVSQALSAANNGTDIGGPLGRGADIVEEVLEMLSPGLVIAAAIAALGLSVTAGRSAARGS